MVRSTFAFEFISETKNKQEFIKNKNPSKRKIMPRLPHLMYRLDEDLVLKKNKQIFGIFK